MHTRLTSRASSLKPDRRQAMMWMQINVPRNPHLPYQKLGSESDLARPRHPRIFLLELRYQGPTLGQFVAESLYLIRRQRKPRTFGNRRDPLDGAHSTSQIIQVFVRWTRHQDNRTAQAVVGPSSGLRTLQDSTQCQGQPHPLGNPLGIKRLVQARSLTTAQKLCTT